ncbi:FtsX-like permease family protein [Streptomyces roseolilacinus]|uniref:Membrane protein n=1 Tax=Streptomyces roseolilacinus TaxID=66904 RepID=A0A918B1R3_9ACTN|nr:FtsX-like permease family protein [Streptomyces roseolilacinus]GGQ00912.1 membrane protein [Streptomyces roseolilacinus]
MGGLVPWVGVRLRTAPGAAVALLLLTLLTSFPAAALPRAMDAYAAEGLRHALETAPADRGAVELTDTPWQDGTGPITPAALAERYRRITAALPEPLRADHAESAYGVRTGSPLAASDPWVPQLDGGQTVFTLSTHHGIDRHAVLRSGRWPRSAGGSVAPDTRAVEAAVTTATARTLAILPGATLHLPLPGGGGPLAVRVTGVVEPKRPEGGYWSFEPVLRTPARLFTSGPVPEPYWHGALLLPPGAAPVLLPAGPGSEAYWRIAADPAGLGPDDAKALRKAVASIEDGPARAKLGEAFSPDLFVESDLDHVLLGADRALAALDPVVAVAAFGVACAAGVVLLMAGGLVAARRHDELALLRARGGSAAGIAGRLLGETAVPVLPAAAAGCAAAFAAVPEGRALPSLLAAGAVALVACGALPARAAFAHRRVRSHGERADAAPARPSRRRTVAELTVLVLAVAAVAALRRRGGAAPEGGADLLASAAPALVALIAALLFVRLHPVPLRLAARSVARRRGPVAFLALARAGRAGGAATLPLLALLVALSTAAFGGSVLTGISDARDRASLIAVGADARVEGDPLPAGAADAVRKAVGVTDVAAVHRSYDLNLRERDTGGIGSVTLLAVDPESYARLAARTGLGSFRAGVLRAPSGAPGDSAVLPALASPGVAALLGGDAVRIGPAAGPFTVRVGAVLEVTPGAASGGEFLVVDAAGVPVEGGRTPTTLLVSGSSVSGAALGAAVRSAGAAGAAVTLRAEVRAGFTDSPAQRGAERIYTWAVTAGAGYAVLALLLALLQAAPERTALLARLRTMGLTRRQGRRLLVLESLPQALLAAGGGVLTGWVAIGLLAPGIDLAAPALAGRGGFAATGPVPPAADPWSLLLPAVAVVVLAVGVAAAQAWPATRRTTTELRAGDAR